MSMFVEIFGLKFLETIECLVVRIVRQWKCKRCLFCTHLSPKSVWRCRIFKSLFFDEHNINFSTQPRISSKSRTMHKLLWLFVVRDGNWIFDRQTLPHLSPLSFFQDNQISELRGSISPPSSTSAVHSVPTAKASTSVWIVWGATMWIRPGATRKYTNLCWSRKDLLRARRSLSCVSLFQRPSL